jgi:tRNA_anti-like
MTMSNNKKNMLKWISFSIIAMIIIGGIVGYKMYTKPHRNVADAKAVAVNAKQLAAAYENNEAGANKAYLDKVMEVIGEIDEVSKNQNGETIIALKGTDMSSVRCTIAKNDIKEPKIGSSIALKGICTGYLTDVVLVGCVVKNDN